jgi:hypothetical protein
MGSLTAKPAPKRLLISAFALAAIALAMFASIASAFSSNSYNGKNLPGHTWTTGNGVVLTNEYLVEGKANTSSSVCVGPVTHDGSGFHMPYGWRCENQQSYYGFPDINAAAGLYNPNSGTFGEFSVLAYGH